ncbi:expressed protein [Phakopsora pachyrhizi]|uniref:Expressed protein n=1 Tax=Phakopsora pachyrhizi TaxID=170000 RepID=A0AAV0AF24_PHAPC|nr:expressed protein [Phakopsora pachyrhizi]
MTKASENEIVKSVQLVMIIFLVFLCVNCFGSFLSLKTSIESQENVLKLPIQSQLNGLNHPYSIRLSLDSQRSSTAGKPSRAQAPKTLKFDLNELPEEMDINLGEEIIEQENEKDLHQVSKKQRMEIVHVPAKHQGLIGHSRSILNTFESFNRGSVLLSNNFINYSGFSPSQIPVTNINIVDSVGHRVLSKDQPSSSKSPPIRIVNLPRFKTVSRIKINQPKITIAQSRQYENFHFGEKSDVLSEGKLYNLIDWESKINSPRPVDTDFSEKKRNYQSSYNRDLHDFIKENLVQLMPQELENYQFTSEFLHGIQNCYWNNELSIFVIAEEKIPYVMSLGDSWSFSRNGRKWLTYSAKGLETPNLHEASDWFAFTSVFLKLYKFENLNGVFFTEKMRRTAVNFFKGLEENLSGLQKRIKHSVLERIFNSLPGYLVCVHGINEIIRPSSSIHQQPLSQQEEALKFFIELHSELSDVNEISHQKRFEGVIGDKKWKYLSLKEQKRNLLYKIVNFTRLQADRLAWIYVELWLINYRPKLHSLYTDFTSIKDIRKTSKFKNSLNKLLFLLFSAVLKQQRT